MLNGFVKVRRGIIEHLHNGQMNLNEFACYCLILLKADYKTGVAWVNSSDFLLGDVSLASVQRALLGLEDKHYIKRFILQGSKKPYPVLVDKFEIVTEGDSEPKRINAVKSKSWKYPEYETSDEPLRSRWGGDHEPLLSRNGAVTDAPATIEESTTSIPKEVRSKNLEEISEKEHMSAFRTRIGQSAWKYLKVMVPKTDKNYSELLARAEIIGDSGQDIIEAAFESFCSDHAGEAIAYPLSMFLKVLDGYVAREEIQKVDNQELDGLLVDLSAISDGAVRFNKKHSAAIAHLLEQHSPEDIKSAFREFYSQASGDDFQVKHAAREFSETAGQLLAVQARRRAKEKQTQELLRASTEAEQKHAAEELAARMKADEELDALIEDTIGGE